MNIIKIKPAGPVVTVELTQEEVNEIVRFLRHQEWCRNDSLIMSDFYAQLDEHVTRP